MACTHPAEELRGVYHPYRPLLMPDRKLCALCGELVFLVPPPR